MILTPVEPRPASSSLPTAETPATAPVRPVGGVIRNMAAGAVSRALIALMGLACIPLYIRILGVEQYALVSLLATFLALSSILDLGVAPSLNREFARLSVDPGKAQHMRDLLRTFECFAWLVAGALAAGAILAAPAARGWFHSTTLPPSEVAGAVALIGITIAAQWPVSLYSGGLIGLQEQVTLAVINVIAVAARSVGTVLVIWLVSPTMKAFLICQVVLSGMQVIVLAWALWRRLPPGGRPRIRFDLIRNLGGLALGMSGTTIIMVMSAQLDKLLLSRLLPLETFGHYMIAWSIAGRLGMLTDPVIDSVFPHMTEVASKASPGVVRDAYRLGVQLMALVVMPLAITIAVFAYDISVLWTGGASYAPDVAALLAPLIIGVGLISLMDVPMALQWAIGASRLIFLTKLAGMLVLLTAIAYLSYFHGIAAGAWSWPVVNGLALVLTVPIVHRHAFHSAQWWYLRDLMTPLLAVAAVVLCWHFAESEDASLVERAVYLVLAAASASVMAVISTPVGRDLLGRYWRLRSLRPVQRL